MIWLQRLLTEFGIFIVKFNTYDKKNLAFHSRTKHIDLFYHIITSLFEDEVLTLSKIQESDNPADMLTNMVNIDKLKLCLTLVNLLKYSFGE